MSNPTRVTGRYGLIHPDPDRYVPTLEHYLRPDEGPIARPVGAFQAGQPAGQLPPAPGDIDRLSLVKDWPMYVNGPDPSNPGYAPDGLGDCYWAGTGHMVGAQSVYAGSGEVLFSNEAIVTGYSNCTGYIRGDSTTDNGTDPGAGLKYLHNTGLVDVNGKVHQVAAYARFGDPQNTNLMAQVLDTFGTVGIGFNVTQGFEDAFNNDEPCTWQPGDPVLGGHWVVLQRRGVGGVGVLYEVTWGGVQRVTRNYNWHQVTCAYAIATQDWITANGTTVQGLDLEQLCEDTADAE